MNEPAPLALDTPATVAAPPTWRARLEERLLAASDWFNPILVKESRQALKSRQFVITFGLVLLAVWIWSFASIAVIGPMVYYAARGQEVFYGYYAILAFPLIVVVPFGAFRSLASEMEDRTYELLCITALKPRQIIGGKLAVAVLQIVVYLSAVAPCLTFTYLLRGIDIFSILLVLTYTTAASLGLAMVALVLATAATNRLRQVILTVAIICGVGFGFLISLPLMTEVVQFSGWVSDPEFWPVHGAAACAYVSSIVMAYLLAASRLTFASGNRSTPLRVMMLVQNALLIAWIAPLALAFDLGPEPYVLMGGLYWFAMGVYLSHESPVLSERVKRSLPQSLLGRAMLTWFNPGPGTGYMFALLNYVAPLGLVFALNAFFEMWNSATWMGFPASPPNAYGSDTIAALCYLVFYLGLGKLVLDLLRRVVAIGLLLAALVHGFLLAVGIGVPLLIELSLSNLRGMDYLIVHVTNPLWTLYAFERNPPPPDAPVVLLALVALSGVVLLLNLRPIAAELRSVRVAKPQRVAEEDKELALEGAAFAPEPASPWD